MVEGFLNDVVDSKGQGALVFGLFGVAWAGSNLVGSAMKGLNRIFRTRERRGFVQRKLLTAAVLYWKGPDRDEPFRWVTPGALLFAAGWVVASIAASIYLSQSESANRTYGLIVAVIAVIVWLYWSNLLFLAGAVLNARLEDARTSPLERAAHGAIGAGAALNELGGEDDDEDAAGGDAGRPALPEEEPLFGRLNLTGGVGERLVELECLGLERPRELACLHGLSLAELLEEVTLKVGYLTEELHERVVARDVARVAVDDGGARLTLLGAAAVLGLEEGAAGCAEERAGFGARAAHRAGCPGGSYRGFV